jgi:hypothetical protein
VVCTLQFLGCMPDHRHTQRARIPSPLGAAPSAQAFQNAVAVPVSRVTDLVALIRAEYREMPGLCLTYEQVQRLWSLDPKACDQVLCALVDAGFLRLTRIGYVRAE